MAKCKIGEFPKRPRQYHVGMLVQGQTAIIQYRTCKDCLSCEIFRYYGIIETTKDAARRATRLLQSDMLRGLNGAFPGRNLTRIIVD